MKCKCLLSHEIEFCLLIPYAVDGWYPVPYMQKGAGIYVLLETALFGLRIAISRRTRK